MLVLTYLVVSDPVVTSAVVALSTIPLVVVSASGVLSTYSRASPSALVATSLLASLLVGVSVNPSKVVAPLPPPLGASQALVSLHYLQQLFDPLQDQSHHRSLSYPVC